MKSKHKCKEKIKQNVINAKNITLENVAKTSKTIENNLKKNFEYLKEQALAELKEYCQQLLLSDCLTFQRKIDDMQKKYDKTYNRTKLSLDKFYKEALNMEKMKAQEKYELEKPEINIKPSVKMCNNKKEMLKIQIVEKLKKLNKYNQQLTFLKNEIEIVLNNYTKFVILTEKSNSTINFILDKEKMYEKYLGCPTAIEIEHLIDYE